MAIDKHFYYIQLHLTDGTPIQLELYSDKSEADKYYNLMLRDKQGLKDSFVGLTNIPTEEFESLSIIAVHERYGHQVSQACVRCNNFSEVVA